MKNTLYLLLIVGFLVNMNIGHCGTLVLKPLFTTTSKTEFTMNIWMDPKSMSDEYPYYMYISMEPLKRESYMGMPVCSMYQYKNGALIKEDKLQNGTSAGQSKYYYALKNQYKGEQIMVQCRGYSIYHESQPVTEQYITVDVRYIPILKIDVWADGTSKVTYNNDSATVSLNAKPMKYEPDLNEETIISYADEIKVKKNTRTIEVLRILKGKAIVSGGLYGVEGYLATGYNGPFGGQGSLLTSGDSVYLMNPYSKPGQLDWGRIVIEVSAV